MEPVELTPEQEDRIRTHYHQIGSRLAGYFEIWECRFAFVPEELVEPMIEISRLLAVGIQSWRREMVKRKRKLEQRVEQSVYNMFEGYFTGHLEGEEIKEMIQHYILNNL